MIHGKNFNPFGYNKIDSNLAYYKNAHLKEAHDEDVLLSRMVQ